jgi:hypothetical protein
VPLSADAAKIVRLRLSLVPDAPDAALFPSPRQKGQPHNIALKDPKALAARLWERAGIKGAVLHDVRRSTRTYMGAIGVRPDVADRVLGHSQGGPRSRRVYDRYDYGPEMREAVERWSRKLREIVTGLRAVETA